MLMLRLKQAEVAINSGRLDEAVELASSAGFRQHRRGQQLIDNLINALIQRSREHLKNQRLDQALRDCQKAEKLGGPLTTITTLQRQLHQEMGQQRDGQQAQHQQLAQANAYIAQGQLSLGEKIAADIDSPHAATALQHQVQVKRMEQDRIFDKASAAFNSGDLETAAELLWQVGTARQQHKQLTDLFNRIKNQIHLNVQSYFQQGRLDLARNLLGRFSYITPEPLELTELSRALVQCREAQACLQNGQYSRARQILEQLQSLYPKIAWLEKTLSQCRKGVDHLETVLTGPLSLAELPPMQANVLDDPVFELPNQQQVSVESVEQPAMPLPQRLLIQIDGVASFLVLRNPLIKIGPVSHRDQPDLGLIASPDMALAVIERIDEDYFLQQPHQADRVHLLRSGDPIVLSHKCRLRFARPNPASATARLDFSSARYPRSDVRGAILLDRELIIGPDSLSHIQTEQVSGPIILYQKSELLYGRSHVPIVVKDRPWSATQPLPLNQSIQLGSLRIVLTDGG